MRHNMMMMMVIKGVWLPCEGGEVVGIYIQKCNGTYLQEGFTYLCFLSISRCVIIIFIDSPVSCECLLCFHNNICTPYRNLVVHQPTKKRVSYGNEWWERQFNSPFRVSWWCGEVVEIIWLKKNLILIDHSVTYSLLVSLQTIIF